MVLKSAKPLLEERLAEFRDRLKALQEKCVSACKIDPLRGVIGVQN